jgi:nucleoside phosphorylase
MSAPVLVCFAVPQEAKPFLKLIRDRTDVVVLVTGIGARNAERAVRKMLGEFSPGRVFSCGFAGALNSQLRIADVVFDIESTDADLGARLQSLGATPAKFFCAETVATTVAEKAALRARTGADAVEMESKTISEVCRERGIECVTLRAISDSAHENLPLDFNALMTPEHELSSVRIAWAILRAPQRIPALVRLGQNSACAAEQLARFLQRAICGPVE